MPHFRRSALPSPAPSAPKTSPHARRHWIFGAACTLALTLVVTGKALAAVMVEYALLLVAVLLLAAADTGLPNGHGFHAVAAHLQSASERAARAQLDGDRHVELAALSKTLGAAQALLKLTSACDDCGDLRDNIQQVIDLAAGLRARALHNTCTPDGIVGSSEQCDPLAQPSGCPVLTLPSFCNDDCECQVVPTEPVPCDLPFPATCDDACQCQPISAGAP